MTDNNGYRPGLNDFEELLLSDFDMFPDDLNLIANDIGIPNDLMEDTSTLFQDLQPTFNSVESSSHDIPINPREWLVPDQISMRQRAPRLVEFLILLLQKPHYASYASYKDKSQGIFEVHQPEKVADLWQQVKNRQANQRMTYDKFARAVRWYYQFDIMKKTNARYTFQFSPKTLKAFAIDENNYTTTNQ